MKRFLTTAVVAAMSVCMLAACGNKGAAKGETAGSEAQTEATSEVAESGAAESSAAEGTAVAEELDLSTVNFEDVAATIEYGDFAGIETLVDEALAGNYDGKVVVIDGINSKLVSTASVMEAGEDGVKKGLTYHIDGKDNLDDYPADDAHIKVTGVIKVMDEYGTRNLIVPEDKVEVIE